MAAGCAAPSRWLTPRQVDDPITLPRKLASESLLVAPARYWPTEKTDVTPLHGFGYGITDRLEWNLFSFRYALLDDAPVGTTPTSPLSLAVGGGLEGLGYTSTDGTILMPTAHLRVMKHVAARWRFEAGTQWIGLWASGGSETVRYNLGTLRQLSYPGAMVSVDAVAMRQLVDRLALAIRLYASQVHGCVDLFLRLDHQRRRGRRCRSRTAPGVGSRSRSLPRIGTRRRPASFTPPSGPDGMPLALPRTVTWLSIGVSAAYYW